MTTPNPSKAQEWWHHMVDELYFVDDYNDQDKFREGVSAIIRESERRGYTEGCKDGLYASERLIEMACKEMLGKVKKFVEQEKEEARKLWDGGYEAPYLDACNTILEHLSSLTNGDVEKKGV